MPYLTIKVFNDRLTDDIVSFEQLRPGILIKTKFGNLATS